jgi:O-antigen ligase
LPVTELDPFSLDIFLATAAAVVFLTLKRPALGTTALLLLGPFDLSRAVGGTTLTLEKAAIAGLALGLLFRRTGWSALRRRPASAVGIALLAVVGATALSVHAALFPGPAVRETFKALEYLLVFGLATAAVAADPDDVLLGRGIAVLAIVGSLAAVADLLTGAHSAVLVGGRAIPRIAGPLEGPNQLAGWLGLLLPVLFALALRWRDLLVTLALGVATVTLALTLSRSGIVAALVGLGVVALWSGTRTRMRALLLGVAVLAIAVVVTAGTGAGLHVLSAEQIDSGNGLATRPQLWHAALALWRTHPLLGIGAGNFELRLPDAGLYGVRTHANDYYLQCLVEGGLPLFAAGLAASAAWVFGLARARSPIAIGVFAAGVAFALHQIVDDLAFYPKVGDLAWCLVGIATALCASALPRAGNDQTSTRERNNVSIAASSTART